MESGLIIFVALACVGAILWTMPLGQRIANRLGLRGFRREGAPREDREFLLKACDGDRERVQAMLDEARSKQPDLTDAQAYRNAIRSHMRSKHGGTVV
jgi:hypothetical protein